jgi:hypothetical protein
MIGMTVPYSPIEIASKPTLAATTWSWNESCPAFPPLRKARKGGAASGQNRHVKQGGSSSLDDRICRMIEDHTWTCVFYVFVLGMAAAPFLFAWHYWHEARTRGWNWISTENRNMYVDGAKTIITASGIAVVLLASSAVSSARTSNGLVASSAKVAVTCLIACVCLSLVVILALLRGFERAWSRNLEEQRKAGNQVEIDEGRLNTVELLLILVPTSLALSCFLVGFVFLGRIAYHF